MAYTNSDKKYYFSDAIKKTTVAFMSLFSNIRIAKNDEAGNFINYRNVSVMFGSKQKFLLDIKKQTQPEFNLYLPRIAVLISGLEPLNSKTYGSEIQNIFNTTANTEEVTDIFRPKPYKLNFTVSILSLHLSESNQILEQIIPFYDPYKTITLQEFSFIPSFTRDIKVKLETITPNFMDELAEEDVRKFIWDLTFSTECYIYKPVLLGRIITTVKSNLIDLNNLEPLDGFTYAVSGNSLEDYSIIQNNWAEI